MKCVQLFGTFWCTRPMLATFLVLFHLLSTLQCAQSNRTIPTRSTEERKRLKFELDIKKECDFISHPNATLNQCGFCVGGNTGLTDDYGKDCAGVCFGPALRDCNGVCAGDSFVDECSGVCVRPGQTTAWNNTNNRDCRGLCIGAPSESSQMYTVDQCGMCRMANSPFNGGLNDGSNAGSNGGPNGGALAALDCNGNCQLPGVTKSSLVCGQCVRSTELNTVLDDCGNCRSEGHPCSCDREPTKCGCVDPNNCYVIKSLFPGAIPSATLVNVSIVGYFYPFAKQLYCIVRRQGFESVESFPVHFLHKNRTVTQCNIQLAQGGEFVLGLGFRKNVFITPPKDLLHLFVYDAQSVNISLVGPYKSLNNQSDSTLRIDFVDLTHDIPPIPIRCKVVFESGQSELGNFGVKPNSCTFKRSSTHWSKSQTLKIYPTFDGVNLIPVFMEHRIEATAPKIFALSSFVSEDGLSVIVNFDKSVDLAAIDRSIRENTDDDDDEPLVMCDFVLGEGTIEHLSLHGLQSCRWATRTQLIITILRTLSSDSVEVQVKPGVLLEHDQKYALPSESMSANVSKLSNSINWWSYEPMVVIVGPNQVSVCGDFALVGLFSSPRGTQDVDFQWEVAGEVSNELRQYVSRNGKSTNLLLLSDMLDIGTEYRFTLKAFIQARRQSVQSSHTVVRLPFEAPIVTLVHTRLLQTTPLYESDNITLLAHVKVPDCVFPAQRLILYWRVSDPRFRFPIKDLKKRFSIDFTVEPFSVPANHPTSISVDSFIGLYQNETSTTSFHFTPLRAPLKANLADGINKITVGSHSGLIQLNSRREPSNTPVVYQWSCDEMKTAQPCYFNFASLPPASRSSRNSLLFTRQMQTQKDVYLESVWLQPNQQYLVGLRLFDANNSKVSSETEYTMVDVVEGIKPQVSIGPVLIKGQFVVPYNTRFSTFLIPFGASLVIRGQAFLESGVKSVHWESATFRYPLSWSSKHVTSQQINTQLNIHEDSLLAYGVYNFKLVACSHQNQCSSSEISLMAAQSVTMCNVMVDSYVELELTVVNVAKCNLVPNSSPFTYQLYLEDEHFPSLLPINAPQLSPVLVLVGTPAFADNQLTRVAVRVCDRFDTCTLHYSPPVSVDNSANLTASVDLLVNRAVRMRKLGDPITALGLTNGIFLKPDTFNESYRSYEAAINITIECGTDALQMPSLLLTKGHFELIFNTLSFALPKTNSMKLRKKLLALIMRFYEKAEAMHLMPSLNSIRTTYSNVMNAFVPTEEQRSANVTMSDVRYLQDIRATFRKVKQAAASTLPLGSRLVLVAERLDPRHLDSEGLPLRLHTAITEIVHLSNVFDVDLRARLSVNQTVVARVQFGEEVRHNLSVAWDCKQSLPCHSVVYAITLFPDHNPFPSEKNTHRLTPVLDLTIHAPNTGLEQTVKGALKAAVFELSVTGNESFGGTHYTTRCHYYDEDKQDWRMDDIQPLGIAYNQAGCWSGHLSTFVVMRSVIGLNTDYIIGVLAACLMGVLVFGMMLVFYVQRKRDDAAAQVQVHKTVESRSASNGHVQPLRHNTEHVRPAKTARVRPSPVQTEIQTQSILVTD